MYFVYLLLDDRKSFMFFPRWVRSFFLSFSKALHDGIPWLPFQVTAWLETYLKQDARVFEFGSGGSTVFFAQRVKNLYTVEHDRKWYELVTHELKRRQFTNVEYLLREPQHAGSNPPAEYWDTYANEYPNMSFEQYVKTIDEHPDHSFDLVLVDGRARKFCIQHAIKKIRPGGYLLLDNSTVAGLTTSAGEAGTREYLDFLAPLKKYQRFDITSISPFWPPAKWQSSGWQIQDEAPAAS
jgi:predicted O-methyltransferase YrrM